QRLGLEAGALADFAGLGILVAPQILAHPRTVGLAEAPFHIGQDALEWPLRRIVADAVVVIHADRLAVGAMEDFLPHPLRQVAPRRVHTLLEMAANAFEGLRVIGRGGMRPRTDRAVMEAAAVVVHDEFGVEIELGAEAVAGRAGAERIVEG